MIDKQMYSRQKLDSVIVECAMNTMSCNCFSEVVPEQKR